MLFSRIKITKHKKYRNLRILHHIIFLLKSNTSQSKGWKPRTRAYINIHASKARYSSILNFCKKLITTLLVCQLCSRCFLSRYNA